MASFKPKNIGIIGGTHGMGEWFKKFFRQNGYKVRIASRKTVLTLPKLVEKSDVVMYAVPIRNTVKVIQDTLQYVKPGTLLMDVTSIKIKPMDAMLKVSKNVEVLGTHPMFAPDRKLNDQRVILVPGRGKQGLIWFKNLIRSKGAKVTVTTADKHDEMMGIIQGVTHLGAISSGLALKRLKISPAVSDKFISPIYRSRLDMITRILSQDPKLYADIQIMNPKAQKSMKTYLKAVEDLLDCVNSKDIKKFEELFKEAADYFGSGKNN